MEKHRLQIAASEGACEAIFHQDGRVEFGDTGRGGRWQKVPQGGVKWALSGEPATGGRIFALEAPLGGSIYDQVRTYVLASRSGELLGLPVFFPSIVENSPGISNFGVRQEKAFRSPHFEHAVAQWVGQSLSMSDGETLVEGFRRFRQVAGVAVEKGSCVCRVSDSGADLSAWTSFALQVLMAKVKVKRVTVVTDQPDFFVGMNPGDLNLAVISAGDEIRVLKEHLTSEFGIIDGSEDSWWAALISCHRSTVAARGFDLVPESAFHFSQLVPNLFLIPREIAPAAMPAPEPTREPSILIAIPAKDIAWNVPSLFEQLAGLDYDLGLVSIGILEGDSSDGTYEELLRMKNEYEGLFHGIFVEQFHLGAVDYNIHNRALPSHQLKRRSRIAVVRNKILSKFLHGHDYVLWFDADLEKIPPTIVRDLMKVDGDIVVPDCRLPGSTISFDLNTFVFADGWVDDQDHLVDELYQPPAGWPRRYLSDFPAGEVVKLDAVGGTCVLVKSIVHLCGINFPTVPVNGYIETEAFGMMAGAFGYRCMGIPGICVIHSSAPAEAASNGHDLPTTH